jgi:hypothetical protein
LRPPYSDGYLTSFLPVFCIFNDLIFEDFLRLSNRLIFGLNWQKGEKQMKFVWENEKKHEKDKYLWYFLSFIMEKPRKTQLCSFNASTPKNAL